MTNNGARFFDKWGLGLLALMAGLLISGVPVLVTLNTKLDRAEVERIIEQTRPGPPYSEDRQYVLGELARIGGVQNDVLERLSHLETEVATLRAEVSSLRSQLELARGGP